MKRGKQSSHMGCAIVLLVWLLIFLGVLAAGRFNAWRWRGRTDDAVIELAATERHTPEDMEQAVQVLLTEFADFRSCTLNRLWYDEEMAAPIEREQSDSWERAASDVLVLFADFQSGEKGGYTPWYELNTHYEDYYFLLVRGENGWQVESGEALTQPETTHEIVTPTPVPTP